MNIGEFAYTRWPDRCTGCSSGTDRRRSAGRSTPAPGACRNRSQVPGSGCPWTIARWDFLWKADKVCLAEVIPGSLH